MQETTYISVSGGGAGRGKVTLYIIVQFALISIIALLAFFIADEAGRHEQWVQVTGNDAIYYELGLATDWQYYVFIALGVLLLIGGGYAVIMLDTRGTSVNINQDGTISGKAVNKLFPVFSSKLSDYMLNADDITGVDVKSKGGVLLLHTTERTYKIYLGQKNGEDIKKAINK